MRFMYYELPLDPTCGFVPGSFMLLTWLHVERWAHNPHMWSYLGWELFEEATN